MSGKFDLMAFANDCIEIMQAQDKLHADAAHAEATLERALGLEAEVTERLAHERKAAQAEIEAARQAKVDEVLLDTATEAKIRRVAEDLAKGHEDEVRAEVAEELAGLRSQLRDSEHQRLEAEAEVAGVRQNLAVAGRQVEEMRTALEAATSPDALSRLLLNAGQS